MSYHCGIGDGMRGIGMAPREPYITCDRCGKVQLIAKPRHPPPSWFLDGKAPPGWRVVYPIETGDAARRDYCKECR